MARIPYPDPAAASAEAREILQLLPPLNIFRMLAHAESLAIPYAGFGGALLTQLRLDPKLRELAVLEVALEAEAPYEWVQHVPIAEAAGVRAEQTAAIQRRETDSGQLDALERAVVDFTRQAVSQPRVDDGIFASLAEHLDSRQIVELLLVIGNYLMLARVMTTLDLEIDEPVGPDTIEAVTKSP